MPACWFVYIFSSWEIIRSQKRRFLKGRWYTERYHRIFWESFGLKITITKNLQNFNFLDVTFDLCTGYLPNKKPNENPIYINVNSHYPPNIIKALTESISKRISNISSDKAAFDNAALFYNDVLSASG